MKTECVVLHLKFVDLNYVKNINLPSKIIVISSNYYSCRYYQLTDKFGIGLSWSVKDKEILIGLFPPDMITRSSCLGITPASPTRNLNFNVWP